MPALSVAIVNDYPVVVRGLGAMLEPYRDRVQVAELCLGRGPGQPVDVTLYDTFATPRLLPQALDALVGNPHAGRVLLYSWNLLPHDVQDALTRGCAGYVEKGASAEELVAAIEEAAAGRQAVHQGADSSAPRHGLWPGMEADLSPRESEVIALITQGLTNQDISTRLNLSINTVKSYIRSAYLKIGVDRRPQAVKWGVEHHMLADRGEVQP